MKGLRAGLLDQASSKRLSDADPGAVRDYYQSVIDSVASVIYTVDRELRITGVNRQWDAFALANWGEYLTSEHILGMPLLSLMKGAARKRWRTVCQQILSGQIPRYLDEIDLEEQVAWRHYTLAASPLKDSQGEILGITLIATNVTQLKKAEFEVMRRLVEMRGLFQVAQIAGDRFDRHAFHRQVTTDIAHLFGAEKCVIFRWGRGSDHLQAQIPAFGLAMRELDDLSLDIGDPADSDSLWQDLEERDYILLNEGDDAPDSMVETSARVDRLAAMMAVLRVGGRIHGTILVAGRDRPFSEREGQLVAAVAVPIVLAIEDADLNQRLLDRMRKLKTAQGELERMTKIAESVRMPLTLVQGYMELLLDGALGSVPEGQRSTMDMLLEKTREIADLANQLLPSQLLPSQFLPDKARYEFIHLADLVREVIDRRIAAIERAGLNLVAQLLAADETDAESPQEYVTAGDPGLLFNVFDALLDNAVKFSPNGGTIHISLHESSGIIYVKVKDPGVGIPAHQLQQVWQPREQRAESDSISLAEVRQIVQDHGGQVWVESQPGRGSVFYVMLPKIVNERQGGKETHS